MAKTLELRMRPAYSFPRAGNSHPTPAERCIRFNGRAVREHPDARSRLERRPERRPGAQPPRRREVPGGVDGSVAGRLGGRRRRRRAGLRGRRRARSGDRGEGDRPVEPERGDARPLRRELPGSGDGGPLGRLAAQPALRRPSRAADEGLPGVCGAREGGGEGCAASATTASTSAASHNSDRKSIVAIEAWADCPHAGRRGAVVLEALEPPQAVVRPAPGGRSARRAHETKEHQT